MAEDFHINTMHVLLHSDYQAKHKHKRLFVVVGTATSLTFKVIVTNSFNRFHLSQQNFEEDKQTVVSILVSIPAILVII
jgi:hypothetical protein